MGPYQTWRNLDGRHLAQVAAHRVADSLETYPPPDDFNPVVRRQLDAYRFE